MLFQSVSVSPRLWKHLKSPGLWFTLPYSLKDHFVTTAFSLSITPRITRNTLCCESTAKREHDHWRHKTSQCEKAESDGGIEEIKKARKEKQAQRWKSVVSFLLGLLLNTLSGSSPSSLPARRGRTLPCSDTIGWMGTILLRRTRIRAHTLSLPHPFFFFFFPAGVQKYL